MFLKGFDPIYVLKFRTKQTISSGYYYNSIMIKRPMMNNSCFHYLLTGSTGLPDHTV